jgi:hypothetical protein
MALFGPRDANVPLLTRVAQVETNELEAFIWQVDQQEMKAPRDTQTVRAENLRQLKLMRRPTVESIEGLGKPLGDLYLEEIKELNKLRCMTLHLLNNIAKAPPDEIILSSNTLFGTSEKDARLLHDWNLEFLKMKPIVLYLNQDRLSEKKPAKPRRDLVVGYGGEGMLTNHWIRRGALELLTKDYDQKVAFCPVCSFPYLVQRTNQLVCSVRCRTRQAKRKQLR